MAATVDHGLRGDEGRADVEHVRNLADAWKVPMQFRQVAVRERALEWKVGIEEAARRARYDVLAGVAREMGAACVAVAHHADDQAETVLMHLLRGAGVDGLAGMRPRGAVPGHPDMTLLRPLLGATRADILAYCQTHAIVPREDATNIRTEPTRNWVRQELLPLIQTRYPGAPRALADLARSAARDVEALDAMTQGLLMQAKAGDGWILMSRPLFRQALGSVQRRTIRWAVAALAPDAELSFERTEATVDLFLNGRMGQKVELAGGLLATVDRETVMLTRTAS